MLSTYRIVYNSPRYGDHIKGLALPIFIRNGAYYLTTLDIYADAVVECWGLIPITSLQTKVDSRWVVTEPPVGGRISIHDLGEATLSEIEWSLPKEKIVSIAQDLFQQLNSDNHLPFDFTARKKLQAADLSISTHELGLSRWRLNKETYRLGEKGEEIAGASVPLFWASPDGLVLTHCFVYQDNRLSIGYGTTLLSVVEAQALFDTESIRTAVDADEWITLPGLGRCKLTQGNWHIEKPEVWKQVLNLLNVLNGQPDIITVCYRAFLAYQENPTAANRELLRIAYEAVPRHHRIYTQRDMDSKDYDIQGILYPQK